MNPNLWTGLTGLLFCSAPLLHAQLTYVDATDGAGGNTTLSDGGTLTADDGTGDTTWRQRDDPAFGSSTTIFEGVDPSPEIRTTLSGLTPDEHYDIYVHYWDPQSDTEDWNIRAGFSSGALTTFSREGESAVAGSTAGVLADTLDYATPPTLFGPESGRENLAGFVGTATADENGDIQVFLDDFGSTDVNLRTWYDGLSYEPSAAAPNPVTYVDAGTDNTTRWDGETFEPAPEGTTSADDNWELRTLGNDGDVLEANADGPEDAPLLVTTIDGLDPDTEYVLYAYFWHDGRNWHLKASADSSAIDDAGTPADLSDDRLPTSPLTNFASANDAGGTATVAPVASSTNFVSTPLLAEGNRTLREAALGTATSNGAGELSVYIDDLAGVSEADRTWYDGVGYKPALELDPDADEDGDGLANGEEQDLGTNPYLVDTDGDSHDDGFEVAAGSDPLDAGSVPPLPGGGLEVAPDGAWTWFNDERAIFHQGSLFSGYVLSDGRYGVTRYDPSTNESFHMIISTGTSRQTDDHNNPSITVLPDGRLMVLYAKHLGGSQFYQRTSQVELPSSDEDWGPEQVHQVPENNTYNNTYLLSSESDRIYNFHRSINFNPTITISNDLGETWEPSIQFIGVGSGGVRPYPRYCSNGEDRIDLIYTDGHPRDVDNSVYHLYYEDGSFRKTDGTLVDDFENLPLDHEGGQQGSVVYPYSAAPWGPEDGPDDWIPAGRGWTWDVHYGRDGDPVCVFQVQRDNVTGSGWNHDRIYYYYARWTGSEWERHFIAQGGRGIYSAEDDYGGGMTIDPDNPNVVYISSNAADPRALGDIDDVPLAADERYELYRGVTEDGGENFTWEQITVDSPADNLRPIVPEDHDYDRTLVWFHGTYNSYTSFNCRVLALLENDLELETSSIGTDSASMSWISSPGRSYRIEASTDLIDFPHEIENGISSQGPVTSHSFDVPVPVLGSPQAFFRVEEE